jgi:hypothetical protein
VTSDNWLGVGFEPRMHAAKPFHAPPVRTASAEAAYEEVLSKTGALPMKRDVTDLRIVREVRAGAGRVIDKVSNVLRLPLLSCRTN